jgi:hypothetical protein
MLPLRELERLAAAYVRDRDRRKVAPRAAEVRDRLVRGCRALALAADAVDELTGHELALVGATEAEADELHGLLESWSAKSGAAAGEVDALGPNGRRR